MLHNGVVVVIVSPSWFFGFAAELQSKILLVARGSSPKLEQTFFTGMGKIDCRAGGDAFFFSSPSGLSLQSPKDAYMGISHAF